jgi:hypothetical protein
MIGNRPGREQETAQVKAFLQRGHPRLAFAVVALGKVPTLVAGCALLYCAANPSAPGALWSAAVTYVRR